MFMCKTRTEQLAGSGGKSDHSGAENGATLGLWLDDYNIQIKFESLKRIAHYICINQNYSGILGNTH